MATAIATGGNVFAVRNYAAGLPVLPTTAWGMLYGAAVAAVVALGQGAAWTFDPHLPYVLSLAYLAVFGSVVAFGAYLTLLAKVGAGPASYVGVSTIGSLAKNPRCSRPQPTRKSATATSVAATANAKSAGRDELAVSVVIDGSRRGAAAARS